MTCASILHPLGCIVHRKCFRLRNIIETLPDGLRQVTWFNEASGALTYDQWGVSCFEEHSNILFQFRFSYLYLMWFLLVLLFGLKLAAKSLQVLIPIRILETVDNLLRWRSQPQSNQAWQMKTQEYTNGGTKWGSICVWSGALPT